MDLIPGDYKRYLQQLHIMQRWALLMVIMISLSVLASIAFHYKAEANQARIALYEQQQAISSQQQDELHALQNNQKMLLDKRETLMQLRRIASAEDMFRVIDMSLDGKNVWFRNWTFDRVRIMDDKEPKGARKASSVTKRGAGNNDNRLEGVWDIQTRMEIDGGASDHEALSMFVRRLLQQPQIDDVRIQNTQQYLQAEKAVVNFRLLITVNDRYKNS